MLRGGAPPAERLRHKWLRDLSPRARARARARWVDEAAAPHASTPVDYLDLMGSTPWGALPPRPPGIVLATLASLSSMTTSMTIDEQHHDGASRWCITMVHHDGGAGVPEAVQQVLHRRCTHVVCRRCTHVVCTGYTRRVSRVMHHDDGDDASPSSSCIMHDDGGGVHTSCTRGVHDVCNAYAYGVHTSCTPGAHDVCDASSHTTCVTMVSSCIMHDDGGGVHT